MLHAQRTQNKTNGHAISLTDHTMLHINTTNTGDNSRSMVWQEMRTSPQEVVRAKRRRKVRGGKAKALKVVVGVGEEASRARMEASRARKTEDSWVRFISVDELAHPHV